VDGAWIIRYRPSHIAGAPMTALSPDTWPTPTPWRVVAGDDYYITADGYPTEFIGHFKSDDNGGYVAVVGNRPKDFGEANAAFIVKAVNEHDALVAEVEHLRFRLAQGQDEDFQVLPGEDAEFAFGHLQSALNDIDISAYNAAKWRIGKAVAPLSLPPYRPAMARWGRQQVLTAAWK
jgi:hypothetical protein